VITQIIRHAAALAARGKRASRDVAKFLIDIDAHADGLSRALGDRTYFPSMGRAFGIHDPKPRCIYALPFRDRVVQHFFIDLTLTAIEKSLRAQTYACRVDKGTHRCLARAGELMRHRAWVLRVDMRKFFPSVDHSILRRLLDRTTPMTWRWLRDRFLDAPYGGERVSFYFPGDDLFTPISRPHGLPIGSLTSQIWANLYLGVMDDLIASHLGIGDFVRYCDDILVFHDDPAKLRNALEHIEHCAMRLRLRLHPRKTGLHRTTESLPFLGFVLSRRGSGIDIRLRHDNVERMRKRMRVMQAMFAAGAFRVEDVRSRLLAWQAHARHGHTRALLKREFDRFVLVCRSEDRG